MVAVILVLGLTIPVLLTMWADVSWRSARSEQLADATFYAQQLMEEIKSKKFVDPEDPTNTALGPNGEIYPLFDDVDDFNGCADSSVTTPASGFTRSGVVDYVTLSGTTWIPSGSSTPYKRITVSVSRTDNLVSDVSLVTIVSSN